MRVGGGGGNRIIRGGASVGNGGVRAGVGIGPFSFTTGSKRRGTDREYSEADRLQVKAWLGLLLALIVASQLLLVSLNILSICLLIYANSLTEPKEVLTKPRKVPRAEKQKIKKRLARLEAKENRRLERLERMNENTAKTYMLLSKVLKVFQSTNITPFLLALVSALLAITNTVLLNRWLDRSPLKDCTEIFSDCGEKVGYFETFLVLGNAISNIATGITLIFLPVLLFIWIKEKKRKKPLIATP
jgi:hypothetical protein